MFEHGCAESSAAPEYSLGPAPSQSEEEGDGGKGETDADLAAAQRAQREALQAEQESVQSSRQGLLEVREALQHQQGQPDNGLMLFACLPVGLFFLMVTPACLPTCACVTVTFCIAG